MKYFEVKVRYNRIVDNRPKLVTETYAIAAQTFTDAERKTFDVLSQYANDGLEVIGEKIAPYDKFIYSGTPKADDKFYLVKYAVVTVDEFTAKEKRERMSVLVEAVDVETATDVFNQMPGDATCRELLSVSESTVLECFSDL